MKHLSGAPLQGRLLTMPANIKLGWKSLPAMNALAYYENFVTYNRKKFHKISLLLHLHQQQIREKIIPLKSNTYSLFFLLFP
jgi:hypothetical protein